MCTMYFQLEPKPSKESHNKQASENILQAEQNTLQSRLADLNDILAKNNAKFTKALPSQSQLKDILEHNYNCIDQTSHIALEFTRHQVMYLQPKAMVRHLEKIFRNIKYFFNNLIYWIDSYSLELIRRVSKAKMQEDTISSMTNKCTFCRNHIQNMHVRQSYNQIIGYSSVKQSFENEISQYKELYTKSYTLNQQEGKEYADSVSYLIKIIKERETNAYGYEKMMERMEYKNHIDDDTALRLLEDLLESTKEKLGEKCKHSIKKFIKEWEIKDKSSNHIQILTTQKTLNIQIGLSHGKSALKKKQSVLSEGMIKRLKEENQKLLIEKQSLLQFQQVTIQTLKKNNHKDLANFVVKQFNKRKYSLNIDLTSAKKFRVSFAGSEESQPEPAKQKQKNLLKDKNNVQIFRKTSRFGTKKDQETSLNHTFQSAVKSTEKVQNNVVVEAPSNKSLKSSTKSIKSMKNSKNDKSKKNLAQQKKQKEIRLKSKNRISESKDETLKTKTITTTEVACQWMESDIPDDKTIATYRDMLTQQRIRFEEENPLGFRKNKKGQTSKNLKQNQNLPLNSMKRQSISKRSMKRILLEKIQINKNDGPKTLHNLTNIQDKEVKPLEEIKQNLVNLKTKKISNKKDKKQVNQASTYRLKKPKQAIQQKMQNTVISKTYRLNNFQLDQKHEELNEPSQNKNISNIVKTQGNEQSQKKKKKNILNNMFKAEHLSLFGGVSESYSYSKLKKQDMIKLSNEDQKKFTKMLNYIENLRNFKNNTFQLTMAFLVQPYKLIQDNQISPSFSHGKNCQEYLRKFWHFHVKACKKSKCEHMFKFSQIIGFSIAD